jgi:hypothetical protein
VAVVGDVPGADDPLLGFAPYAHAAPRANSLTPARQRAFVAELAACGIVTQAARKIGASVEALYKLRHKPGAEAFAAAWDAAIDRGMARLEDCALERALQGEVRPVVRGGKVVATWRRYDTALLVFLLRQRRAQRFGARMVDAEPEVSATEAAEMIDAKLARLRAVVEAREAEEALRDDGEE